MTSSGDERIQHYPRRLTCVLSSAKIVSGCGLLATGASALYLKASYGDTASGIWAGTLVIISGVFGIFSVLRNASRPYVLGFFISCVLSLIACVLVIIYSATGLARDSGFPSGFARDMQTDKLKDLPERELAMLVNLVLILLGVLDVLFTLPSCIICLRDLCECYSPDSLLISDRGSAVKGSYIDASHSGNATTGGQSDWLMSWLGQQNQIFYSTTSGNFPYSFGTKLTTGNSGQPYHLIPAGSSGRRTTTPPYVFIPSDPSQASVPPAMSVPLSPAMIQQLPSPTRKAGAPGSQRHSRRDHHSPHYQHPNNPYQKQHQRQRYESESSSKSKKQKRRTRPRSGSPFRQESYQDHHRPRPRPQSTPNTIYSTSGNSRIAEAPYSPVGLYPPIPPHPQHPQYVYAAPHPSQLASYPSPGSHFPHAYAPHPSASGAPPHLLQVSPWPVISTPDDYEAYLAGALPGHGHYNQVPPPHHSHRDASDGVDSAVDSQKKSKRQSRHHKSHYGQHPHQLQFYHHSSPYNFQYQQVHKRQRSKSSDKRYKRASGGVRESRKKNAPSDSDLDKTYTGLDRELAEEFIEQTMDPTYGTNQQISSSAIVHEEKKRPGSKSGGSSRGGLSPTRISSRQSVSVIPRPITSAGDDETQEESAEDNAW